MQTCIGMMQLQGWDCGSFSVPAYLPRSVRSMEMQKVRRGTPAPELAEGAGVPRRSFCISMLLTDLELAFSTVF
jgi:hypothetical protein